MLAVRIEVRGSGSRAAVAFAYEAQVTWPPCCRSFVGVVVCLDLSNASLLPVMKGQRVRENVKRTRNLLVGFLPHCRYVFGLL